MYTWGFEKRLTLYLLGGGILNLICNFTLVFIGKFSAFSSLISTAIACAIVTILCKIFFEKRVGIKAKFLSKKILQYFIVALAFIPIATGVKMLDYGFWFNIVVTMVCCMSVYGGFLLITKDPLVDTILQKFKRKK
jgi:hypothetical protein